MGRKLNFQRLLLKWGGRCTTLPRLPVPPQRQGFPMKSWLAYLPSAGIMVYTTSFQLYLHHFGVLFVCLLLVCCSFVLLGMQLLASHTWEACCLPLSFFPSPHPFIFFPGVESSFSAAQADLEIHSNSASVSQVLDYWYMSPCLSCTWWRSIYYLPEEAYPNQFGHVAPSPILNSWHLACLLSYRKTSVSLHPAVM